MICPRCLQSELREPMVMNSLSRRDNHTYICERCGTEEALLDSGLVFLTNEIIERDARIQPIERS